MSKSSFTTLNRWLGKKNREKVSATPNGKFSKSSSNLSISTANLNETSQLEYNRITPLPAATSNAPFEQTFRITVLLPKDQLYVCRLGARVPLSKLLELVCENKLLDADKYEFRNPVDASQIYNCELTIGAVGLSEIRLCHKSESYDNFNADEVIKLHRTNMRDSLSSSEFSSRNSKSQTTTKTPSPYSSSNSLNSMDSTGMNYTRTPVTPSMVNLSKQPPALTRQTSNTSAMSANSKIAAPPRKKRTAPRPPNQMAIPEKSALDTAHGSSIDHTIEQLKGISRLPSKEYYASTPNLPIATLSAHESNTDCNGNVKLNGQNERITAADQQIEEMNARNLYTGSVQDLSSDTKSSTKLPEPSPRKRIMQMKKKSSAPAPPPRGSGVYSDDEDAISIASNAASMSDAISTEPTPLTPTTPQTTITLSASAQSPLTAATSLSPQLVTQTTNVPIVEVPPDTLHNVLENATHITQQSSPMPRKRETLITTTTIATTQNTMTNQTTQASIRKELTVELPKPVPRQTSTTLLNPDNVESIARSQNLSKQRNVNVSKVMLNRTPTPEPRSLSTEPSEMDMEDDDNLSKQADSGIGEPIPSPLPESLPSEGSAHECKSTFESSSDDDDIVKVYNFKLCKTVKPLGEHKTLDDLSQLRTEDSGETTPVTLTQETTPSSTDTTSWNFAIPISPPPTFADKMQTGNPDQQISKTSVATVSTTDAPIEPKINERPVLNFDAINTDTLERKKSKTTFQLPTPVTPMPSPVTPMNEIVDELSTIITENRMDSLIKHAKAHPDIEAAKPNTLSNFSIAALSQHAQQHQQQNTLQLESFKSSTTISKVVVANSATSSSSTHITSDAEDDSKLYRKRGSITSLTCLQQQRKSLTRADSFQQPTRYNADGTDANSNGLNSRSSSHLCLTKIEQNGLQATKRRSSSELSIGKSPSLQSLEVIKAILNSRKNSLTTSSDGEGKVCDEQRINETTKKNDKEADPTVVARESVAEATKRIDSGTHPQTPEPAEQSKQITEPAQISDTENTKSKDLPKTYRYSGPPSINFSTWSDRPKVQVAIKNEGDYIFGGQQANKNTSATDANKTVPRNYRMSTPTGILNFVPQMETNMPHSAQTVTPKLDSATARMGIPDKEYKVPITVKPLPDVTVELRGKLDTTASEKLKSEITKSTKVEYNITKQNNVATLPRNFGNNRFSTTLQPTTTASTGTVPGPALLRNTSINNNIKRLSMPYGSTTATGLSVAPFGQGTLRRTGLKEKILATEQESKEVSKNNVETESVETTKTHNLNSTSGAIINENVAKLSQFNGHGNNATITKSITSFQTVGKLELNIQNYNSAAKTIKNDEIQKIKLQSPKSAPVVPPPPPLAMNTLKLKSFKSVPDKTNEPTINGGDTRDALLEAIRNFRKDALNRI